MPKRSKRGGQWKKRYGRERINSGGKEGVAIWGYVIFSNGQSKSIGHANQEGNFSRKDQHAEANWVKDHLGKLEGCLRSDNRTIQQIEFDVTLKPCPDCRIGPLPKIRAALGSNSTIPIYVFVDTQNKFTFDHYVEITAAGFVTATPQPDT